MRGFFSARLRTPRALKAAECQKQRAYCLCRLGLLVFLGLLSACLSAFAQQTPPALETNVETPPDEEKSASGVEVLQKTTENTVASIMSVPIENKSNFNMGPADRYQNVVNIKPLIPIQLSNDWRLIARVIQPLQWQPYVNQRGGGEVGLGDINPTLFLSRVPRGILAWGAGPTFVVPTATHRILGQGKFSIGPEFALFVQPGRWTYGVLISNVWSVAGSRPRASVNQMQLQYFLTYRLKKGWAITTSPTVAANWKASAGNIWTVPFGGGLAKVVHFGARPAIISTQFYENAVRPSGASSWGMRLQTEFLFPKRGKPLEN